jgi:hypothetical protein
MKETTVFRAQFIVAWPIWAGGYPTQQQALEVVEQNRVAIIAMLNERLHSLLGEEYSIQELQRQLGTYTPISGLWPDNPPPNSVNLITIIGASQSAAPKSNLADKIANTVEDLAGLLSAFSKEEMPGAASGANIYDVTSQWDPALALSYVESGESLVEIEGSTVQSPLPKPDQPASARNRVFISYAHKDARWLTRLQVHLMPLTRYFSIDLWDDTKIRSGMKWREELEDAIRTARVAILLISAHFLASDFILRNELPPLLNSAENDGALILPVIVAPSMFSEVPELSRYQAVNDPNAPLVGLSKIRQEKTLNETALRVKLYFSEKEN